MPAWQVGRYLGRHIGLNVVLHYLPYHGHLSFTWLLLNACRSTCWQFGTITKPPVLVL